jgi:pimeloyl-ACP methyl ester carboxylesterase/ribosomal protein S18 acetylase RimI-like enzyme
MTTETDLDLGGGRTLHVYDTGTGDLAVFWHHGTPNVGEPPEPLLAAAAERGIRWVSYDRPGYGGSTPRAGRDIASAAGDVAAVADALGIARFAVMGHSGGATHALASAALLPDRVMAAACLSTVAPRQAEGLDWYAGMVPSGAARLRAAEAGRAALAEHVASAEFDPAEFTPADHAVLSGPWSWLGRVAGKAEAGPAGGMIDDELAYVAPWGFDPADVDVPVLFVHGGEDRVAPSAHAGWLTRRCRRTELWLRPEDGHLSVLDAGEAVLDWLRAGGAVLRPARAEDAAAIATIWYEGWGDGHRGNVPEELAVARTRESFDQRAVQRIGDATVATVDGAVAGFVMVVGDEVEQVYVGAGHRGTRVAAALLAEAERRVAAAGHERAWLAVVAGNARARRFYERNGWVDEGLFDHHAPNEGGPITVPAHRYTKRVQA